MSDNNRTLQDALKGIDLSGISKFDFNIQNTPNTHDMIRDQERRFKEASRRMEQIRSDEVERQERNNELLELNAQQNEQMLKLKETELDFLKSISGDTNNIVNLLANLEALNKANGTITEANLLLIQQRLDEINASSAGNPSSINQLFLEEIKKQIVEKGVGFGIQFFFTGLKYLVTKDSTS